MKKGWEYKKFGEVCWYNKNNGLHKGTRYVGMEHIEQGTGRLLCTISSDDVLSNTFAFNKGDVLYGRLRPYLKKVIVADFDGCCSTELFPIQSKDIIAPFLKYWFLTDEITNKINATCAGCRMPRGNMNDVLKFDISYPPLSEQQTIVDYLDSAFAKIDAMKANAEKALNEAKALFQASLKEMLEPKEGWEEKTLKEVSVISGNYGLSVPSTEYNGIRYLRITDITEWGDLNDEKVSAKLDEEKEQELLEEGDILFARTGATVGKTLMYKETFGKCLFAGYLIRYRLNKAMVLPKFLFYITHSANYYKWVLENQKAAAQPNISAKLYNNYIVLYPPLSEQQFIVATLDSLKSKVDRLQANYEKISQECDALKQAILRQVFE